MARQPHVYVATALQDLPLAERLAAQLVQANINARTSPRSPGNVQALADLMRSADAVVVVLSALVAGSRQLRMEVRIAQAQHKRIIPVLVAGDHVPALFQEMTVIDMREDRRAALEAITAQLRPSEFLDPQQSPAIEQPVLFAPPPVPRRIWLLLLAVMVVGTVLGFVLFG